MSQQLSFVIISACCLLSITTVDSAPKNAEIIDLPGITYKLPFKHYSGYLNASSKTYQHYFFYWFAESQGNPSKDPIVLWLNGGPGCSSLMGLMQEHGPFHNNYDGETLFENRFTWNKAANVLFIESPTGIGFSYATDGNDYTNDEQTATDNYHALIDFFNKYEEYKDHDLYITGESYGGVYVPTLTKKVVDGINQGSFPNKKLKGMAIGNGLLSAKTQANSVINLLYYRGVIGYEQWNEINDACCPGNKSDECNYFAHLKLEIANDLSSDGTLCGNLSKIAANDIPQTGVNSPYNAYQMCYNFSNSASSRYTTSLGNYFPTVEKVGGNDGSLDTARLISTGTSSNDDGFSCFNNAAISTYMNNMDVKKAVHVTEDRIDNLWQVCNLTVNEKMYNNTHLSVDEEFDYILSNSNIRILVYNGDVDYVCNFLGDQWFVRDVAERHGLNSSSRIQWKYGNQIAGFVQTFGHRIDLLTVQGSGHLVPIDRPGPALQMITNFIRNPTNYSKSVPFAMDLKPLNKASSVTITYIYVAVAAVVVAVRNAL